MGSCSRECRGVTQNPFDLAFKGAFAPEKEREVVARAAEPKEPPPPPFIIDKPGAYPGIPAETYHRVEICVGPSISSSGLKLIEDKSPAHYWEQSPLNPHRKPPASKPHFSIGHLLHDILLAEGEIPEDYHVVPDGFVAAHHHKWAEELPGYRAAVAAGHRVLQKSEFDLGVAMAESASKHELAGALLTAGEPEMTLAVQDPKTGRWMRAQPDVLPATMEIIPDVKTAIDASPNAFERAATKFGYFQQAAHYLDVIDILYGEAKRRFVLIVIEKAPPYMVTIYHLDDGDIHYGRMLNRRALNLFDQCLKTGVWHGYSPPDHPILPLQMAGFARHRIDKRIELGELSWGL